MIITNKFRLLLLTILTMAVTSAAGQTLFLSTTRIYATSAAQDRTFNIVSDQSWTVSSSETWLTITENASGTGNATVKLCAEENASLSERSAIVTVTTGEITETLTFTQHGKALYLSVNINRMTFSSSASTQSFSIVSNTAWTVTSSESWLTVSPGSGNGDGTISVTVLENTGSPNPREANLTITGAGFTFTVKVYQACSGYLTVSTTTLRFNPDAGTQKFILSSNVSWNISMEGGNGWLTVTPTKKTVSGNDVTEITVAATDNTSSLSPREATLTITGGGLTQTVNVEQSGSGYLTVSSTKLTYNPGATTQKFSVTSNIEWSISVTGGEGWLTVSPLEGFGNAEITVKSDGFHEQYPMPHYDATITIAGGGYTQTVRAMLSGTFLVVNNDNIQFNNAGGTQMIGIASRTPFSLTIEKGCEWLTADLVNDDGVNRDYSITAKENNSLTDREATIIIETETGWARCLTVLQSSLTDIKGIENNFERTMLNGKVYDLYGRSVKYILNNRSSKGIYIVNGKKYIIK